MAQGKKTGGRQAGTPNRLTFQLRQSLNAVLADEIDRIPELLESINDPLAKMNIILSLLKLSLPPVKPATEVMINQQLIDPEVAVDSMRRKSEEAQRSNEQARLIGRF